MKKGFLIGLGVAASAAFILSKKLTESQKDKIAMKVDEFLLNIRDTAVKYDKYAREYLDENRDTINNIKENVADKFNKVKDEADVNEAFSSLKKATSDLKDYITNNDDEKVEPADNGGMQDDIFIDDTDHEELPTETFYPEGWHEPAKSLDDNSEPLV